MFVAVVVRFWNYRSCSARGRSGCRPLIFCGAIPLLLVRDSELLQNDPGKDAW
jgi:hypothetical protein